MNIMKNVAVAMGFIGLCLCLLAALVAFVYGYVLNIIQLVHHTSFGIEEALRVLGVFLAPVGFIMGIFV